MLSQQVNGNLVKFKEKSMCISSTLECSYENVASQLIIHQQLHIKCFEMDSTLSLYLMILYNSFSHNTNREKKCKKMGSTCESPPYG